MPIQTFPEILVVDQQGSPASGATIQAFDFTDTAFSTPLPASDLNGLPLELVANSHGMIQQHRINAASSIVVYRSGSMPPFSRISLDSVKDASTAAVAASESASDAAATVATLQEWLDLGITRKNLVANPRAVGRAFGTAGATGVQSDEATDGPVGAGYRKLVLTGTTTSSPITIAPSGTGTAAAQVIAGRTYTFSAYSRMVGGPASTQGGVDVNWYTAAGVAAGNDSTYQGVLVNGVWTRHSKTVVAPANAAFALVTARFSATAGLPTAGAEYGAAGFMIEESSSLGAYFDGGSPSSTGRVNRWTGPVNGSVSEQLDMSSIKAIPPGGEPGQSLIKAGVEDWATTWATVAGVGAGGIVTWGSIHDKPTTFPASSHTHTPAQISGATPVGRALMTAEDAQVARVAIGAGTGNGTSNLTLGDTASTAAPGNHTHNAMATAFTPTGNITATDVQGAIVQAAATGGGSTDAGVAIHVVYDAGGYPTQPSTYPASVKIRYFYGPVAYTGPTVSGIRDIFIPTEA